jgi:hypothetical protein
MTDKKCSRPGCGFVNVPDAVYCARCSTPLAGGEAIEKHNDFLIAVVPWMKITDLPQATIAVYAGVACLVLSAVPLLMSQGLYYTLGGAVWILALACVACAVGTYLGYQPAAIIGFCVSVLNALLVSLNDYTSHLLFIISLLLAAGAWAAVKGTSWKRVNAGGSGGSMA